MAPGQASAKCGPGTSKCQVFPRLFTCEAVLNQVRPVGRCPPCGEGRSAVLVACGRFRPCSLVEISVTGWKLHGPRERWPHPVQCCGEYGKSQRVLGHSRGTVCLITCSTEMTRGWRLAPWFRALTYGSFQSGCCMCDLFIHITASFESYRGALVRRLLLSLLRVFGFSPVVSRRGGCFESPSDQFRD